MTDYLNNPYLVVADKYLEDKDWYANDFWDSLGTFEWPLKYNDQTKVQLNKVIATQAKIRVGIEKEYPEASKSQLKSLLVTAHWFTGLVSMTHAQWEDWIGGNPRIAKEYGRAGREKVLQKYTWDKITKNLDDVIKSIS